MIYTIPVLQDATIYENDPYRNTGLDPVLELRKNGDVTTNNLTESRILMKFSLSNISSMLSENNLTLNDVTASIRLYPVQESNLPLSYTIEAKALSANWTNGSGYLLYPETTQTNSSITDGATWITTAGSGSATWSASLASGTAILYNTSSVIGGGVWYTASIASQSFNFRDDNSVDINITNIFRNWYTGSFQNNGVLISFNNNAITASNYPQTLIQFYSVETTTVNEPQLYLSWNAGVVYSSSLATASISDNSITYVRDFKGTYPQNQKNRVLLGTRKKFPRPEFTQNSVFANQLILSSASYYQIKDAHNDKIIVPYSEATKISANDSGNYFDFYSTMMYPERYYKFEIKTTIGSLVEYISSNDFTFKIVR